jgi:hypothetical protein
MLARFALALVASSGALFLAAPAAAAVDPAEYDSAVANVLAVDASIDVPANSSSEDFVIGASHNEDAVLALTARSGANGEAPSGRGVATAPRTQTQFEVLCLDVAGNLAAVGVVVTRSTFLPVGTELIVFVRDTGLPGGMGDGHQVIALPAESCDGSAPLALTVPPHEAGNWAVNDAVALP